MKLSGKKFCIVISVIVIVLMILAPVLPECLIGKNGNATFIIVEEKVVEKCDSVLEGLFIDFSTGAEVFIRV